MTIRIGTVAVAVIVAVGLAGCGALTEESKRGSFDDAGINAAVEKTLATEAPAFAAVTVTTASGTVYLTGIVADTSAKQRATDLARHVEGVREVIDNLRTGTGAPA